MSGIFVNGTPLINKNTSITVNRIGDVGYTLFGDNPGPGRKWTDGEVISAELYPVLMDELQKDSSRYVSFAEFESEVENNGQCAKFGLDIANQKIRLPLIQNIYLKVGSEDYKNIFEKESLPNITGTLGDIEQGGGAFTGAFYSDPSVAKNKFSTNIANQNGVRFDASRSSDAYQDDAEVNPNHICLRMFVVVSETNSILENNPFFFGQSIYSPIDPENMSWLKSDGEYKDGTVYEGMYDWLINKRKEQEVNIYCYKNDLDHLLFTITDTPKVGDFVYAFFPMTVCGTIESFDDSNTNALNIAVVNPNDGTKGPVQKFIREPGGDSKQVVVSNPYIGPSPTSLEPRVLYLHQLYAEGGFNKYVDDYDFIIDTKNKTFRLPLRNGDESIISGEYINLDTAVKGVAPANGWVKIRIKATKTGEYFILKNETKVFYRNPQAVESSLIDASIEVERGDEWSLNNKTSTETTNAGTWRFYYAQGNGNLYYYAGDSLKTAGSINMNDLATKEDIDNQIADALGGDMLQFAIKADNEADAIQKSIDNPTKIIYIAE